MQKVWRKYQECCATSRAQELGMQPVAYRTFCRYWLLQLDHIVIGKPSSDVCWTCQQNSLSIMKIANMTDKDKEKVIKIHETVNIKLLLLKQACAQLII